MKVVNPIGRKADDAVQVNACRCSLKFVASQGKVSAGCACQNHDQMYLIAKRGY